MPIEVQIDKAEEVEPGQQAYEALAMMVEVATDAEILALLAALKRAVQWEQLPAAQRELCASLEDELFDDHGG